LLGFYHLDVKPAIRVRRRYRSADVISQLLQQGFNDVEILTEALTCAAAGMATTREFITVAAWQLLDEPELRSRYLAGREASVRPYCTKSSGSNPWLVSCDGPPGSPSTCRRRTGR
jgi:cytochrome P450